MKTSQQQKPAGKIDTSKLPNYLTTDSFDRGIFQPEHGDYCTPAQLRDLLADAEFYTDKWGPDECPPGLKQSAAAVVRHCRRLLGIDAQVSA